jgi:hypothetical protein
MVDLATLRICGIDVGVIISSPDDWASGGLGRSCQVANRITLRKDMKKDVEGGVLLHEVIHLIADMNELEPIKNNETVIAVLANALNAFLRDNTLEYWGGKNKNQ